MRSQFICVVVAALLVSQSAAFKVCGYYCGPNWCADDVISEQQCVATGLWGSPSAGGNCADSCCRTHDYCCGSGQDRPSCNDAIVACIQSNKCYWSVCGALVWAAMKTVDDWCCGSPCPTYFNSHNGTALMSLANKAYCSPKHALRLEFPPTSEAGQHVHVTGSGLRCENIPYTLDQTTNDVFFKVSSDCLEASFKKSGFAALPDTLVYMPHAEQISLMTESKEQIILTQC